jgi:hypothetical protein
MTKSRITHCASCIFTANAALGEPLRRRARPDALHVGIQRAREHVGAWESRVGSTRRAGQ